MVRAASFLEFDSTVRNNVGVLMRQCFPFSRRRGILPLVLPAVLALCGWTTSAVAQDAAWARKMFSVERIDFGVVARGSETVRRVKIRNLYEQTVHITDVRTTCGCSVAKPDRTTLQSLEEAIIEVKMNTRKFTRRKDSNLVVSFDAPLVAEVRIPITAYIRTDVVLTPGSAAFGTVDQTSGGQVRIDVAYAGRDTWQIRSVKTNSDLLDVQKVETRRGNGRVNYDLVVSVKSGAPAGPFREQIVLLTDDANSPQVPVLVEGTIEADITVTPGVLALGELSPGETKSVRVVIRGREPLLIGRIERETAEGGFKIRLPQKPSRVHVLPMTVTAPEKPGDFSETFTVTIDGRDEPVTFRAYGTIVEPTSAP